MKVAYSYSSVDVLSSAPSPFVILAEAKNQMYIILSLG